MSLPDSTQRRIDKLVDRDLYRTEAQYHAQVQFMQRWLEMTQMAMEDERIGPTSVERVLNRLVYGAPDPYDAHERVATHQQMREMAEKMPPGPFKWPKEKLYPDIPSEHTSKIRGPY